MVVMQASERVLSTQQQSKFRQLQLAVAALEQQVKNTLTKQLNQTKDDTSDLPIPLTYVSDRTAKTGIKLVDTDG